MNRAKLRIIGDIICLGTVPAFITFKLINVAAVQTICLLVMMAGCGVADILLSHLGDDD